MNANCKICRFSKGAENMRDGEARFCRRYPEAVKINDKYWCGEWGDRLFSELKAAADNASVEKFSANSYGSGYRSGFDEGKRQGHNDNQELIHDLREQIERSESKFIGEAISDPHFKMRVEKAMDEIFQERGIQARHPEDLRAMT